MDSQVSLVCYIPSPEDDTFVVCIEKSRYVQELVYIIKTMHPSLANVHPYLINIHWHPIEREKLPIELESLSLGKPLESQVLLSSFLTDIDEMPSNTVHLIVTVSKTVYSSQSLSTPSPVPIVAARRFWEAVWGRRGALEVQLSADTQSRFLDFSDHMPFVEALFQWPESRILIRQEYIEAHKAAVSCGTALVLTGQPGIGKSVFLLYMLVQLLYDRKVVAFESWTYGYIRFDETGPTWHSDHELMPRGTWAISDSTAKLISPSEALSVGGCKTVQAASPRVDRWKDWSKYRQATIHIMHPWDSAELALLCKCLELNASQQTKVLKYADIFGPTPRLLLSFIRDVTLTMEERAMTDVVAAARQFVWQNPVSTMMDAELLNGEAGGNMSSNVVFIRPTPSQRFHPELYSPTVFTALMVAKAFADLQVPNHANLLSQMSHHRSARPFVRSLYEVLIHLRFISAKNPPLCQWKMTTPLVRTALPRLSLENLVVNLGNLKSAPLPIYFQPSPQHFRGIDAVVVDNDNIFALQVAVSNKYVCPDDGLELVWGAMNASLRKKKWHFVFVVPWQQTGVGLLQRLTLAPKWKNNVIPGFCVVPFDGVALTRDPRVYTVSSG